MLKEETISKHTAQPDNSKFTESSSAKAQISQTSNGVKKVSSNAEDKKKKIPKKKPQVAKGEEKKDVKTKINENSPLITSGTDKNIKTLSERATVERIDSSHRLPVEENITSNSEIELVEENKSQLSISNKSTASSPIKTYDSKLIEEMKNFNVSLEVLILK